jgi:ATP-dependent Clp protease ATP-binding subunit ClpB
VYDRMKSSVMGELRKHFRPEFLNRVDETIVFHSLTEKDLMRIVEIQLGRLRERLADRKITLVLTDEAKKHVVKVGYDPNYGARPLKRTLQKEIETGLAKRMLKGDIPDGSTVTVDYDLSHDALSFQV